MAILLDSYNGKITKEQILELEEKYDVKLEESYIQFLYKTNGGFNSSSNELADVFTLKISDEEVLEVNIDKMFGIGHENKSNNIEKWTDSFVDLKSVIAIGRSELSGLIIYVDDSEQGGYYYYDHTYWLDESSDENNTYWLCKTFDEFQSMVKNPD